MTTATPDIGTTVEINTDTTNLLGKPHNVILFNDESHSMDEVVSQLMKATGCTISRANQIMMEAHNAGRAIAFSGGLERCEHVESILAQIHLGTQIEQA
jgi:ATP-dependent Clp protease adaptor protein ClpS